jgi:membrane-bound inhibitor of C-type lysozyme
MAIIAQSFLKKIASRSSCLVASNLRSRSMSKYEAGAYWAGGALPAGRFNH